MINILIRLLFIFIPTGLLLAEGVSSSVRVGVPTVLSGDFADLGQNIVNTVTTYKAHYLRHPLVFEFEDAKLSSADGLRAYQKLINFSKADVLIGATTSNGTLAAINLINTSKTVTIRPVTGGSALDRAGEWLFRLGNSDILNGSLQAETFIKKGFSRVAVLSEETEYTLDISRAFTESLKDRAGFIVWNSTFTPGTTDFRSQLSALLATKPQAVFIPTQTGTALALILNQLSQLGGFNGEIHTTFTAATNPDANALAKGKFKGLHYLAPAYNKDSPRLKEFFGHYRREHGRDPLIAFHTAATVDALDLLQAYLDGAASFKTEAFRDFLLSTKDYDGLMGRFTIDNSGNTAAGFVPAAID